MKPHELQEIIQSDKKLTIQEVEDIICELKDDTVEIQNKLFDEVFIDSIKREPRISNYVYCNGERDAFYICLDLLNKVDTQSNSMFEDIKTGLEQAIEYEKGNKK